MPLKDAPRIDRETLSRLTTDDLLDMIQDLTNKAYYNRQLFEYACKEHVADLREVEMELVRNGIPEDDGYSCYAPAERVRLLAAKIPPVSQSEHDKYRDRN
jgi:hypothetical protein